MSTTAVVLGLLLSSALSALTWWQAVRVRTTGPGVIRVYPLRTHRDVLAWRWLVVHDGLVLARGLTLTRQGAGRQARRTQRRLRGQR